MPVHLHQSDFPILSHRDRKISFTIIIFFFVEVKYYLPVNFSKGTGSNETFHGYACICKSYTRSIDCCCPCPCISLKHFYINVDCRFGEKLSHNYRFESFPGNLRNFDAPPAGSWAGAVFDRKRSHIVLVTDNCRICTLHTTGMGFSRAKYAYQDFIPAPFKIT